MSFDDQLAVVKQDLEKLRGAHLADLAAQDAVIQDQDNTIAAQQAEIADQNALIDYLEAQLAECQQEPPEEPEAVEARLLDYVNLREGPGVTFGKVLPQPMTKGDVVTLFEARALGIFHDTEIISPSMALKLTPADVGSGEVWARVKYLGVTGWAAVIYGGQVLMESVEVTPEPEPEPEPTPARMPFGPYYARLDEQHLADDIIRSKVPVALLNVGENEAIGGVIAKRALADDPTRLIIIRDTRHFSINQYEIDVPLEHQWNNPRHGDEDNARNYWGYMRGVLNSWGLTPDQRARTFVMPINEWDGMEPAPSPGNRALPLTRMNNFYLELMNLAQADGYRICLFTLPEGNPEKDEWDVCRQAITNAVLFGHMLGPHAYFEPHGGAHGYTDPAFILRYRDLRAKCDQWNIDYPLTVLCELAPTSQLHNGVGYRGMGMSIQTMMQHLYQTALELIKDGVLACIFAQSPYPDPWGSYDYGYDREVFYDILADWNTVNQ